MDLFKFALDDNPTFLDKGQMIGKTTSIMWTERYADPGEFEIVAPLSSGLKTFLPTGTLISHVDTMEFMIVENQEIQEKKDEDPIITITGRSFETFLENRIVGVNQAKATTTNLLAEYVIGSANLPSQIVSLINAHISSGTTDPDDEVPNIVAATGIVSGATHSRTMERGTVYERVMDLLKIDNLGIRTIRRNNFSVPDGSDSHSVLSVFNGGNRSGQIIFSWKGGDLDSADYLFSGRKLKNSALITSKYLWTTVDLGPAGYNRRFMIVDAGDIDQDSSSTPAGATKTTMLGKMEQRGRDALKRQIYITLTRADISNTTRWRYRYDYNVGDLVTVDGNFDQSQVMRVVEYVEIQDENGESGHPTLAPPEDPST